MDEILSNCLVRVVPASCAIMRPWEAVVIGSIGGLISILGIPLLDKMKIDDPVGAISVHLFSGVWVCKGKMAISVVLVKT